MPLFRDRPVRSTVAGEPSCAKKTPSNLDHEFLLRSRRYSGLWAFPHEIDVVPS